MRQFSCVTKENKLEVVMRIFQHSVLITSSFLGQSGAKTKIFPRWKLVDFIRRSTIYYRCHVWTLRPLCLYRFWEAFLKNRLITPHTDATALHYHPTVISFECNRQIPHSAFLSILLKTTSIYFCQEPGNRANERVSLSINLLKCITHKVLKYLSIALL